MSLALVPERNEASQRSPKGSEVRLLARSDGEEPPAKEINPAIAIGAPIGYITHAAIPKGSAQSAFLYPFFVWIRPPWIRLIRARYSVRRIVAIIQIQL